MGGEYQYAEFREVQTAGSPLSTQVPFIRPEHTRPGSDLPPKNTSGVSSDRVMTSVKRKLLESRSKLEGNGPVEGVENQDVWYFSLIAPDEA